MVLSAKIWLGGKAGAIGTDHGQVDQPVRCFESSPEVIRLVALMSWL